MINELPLFEIPRQTPSKEARHRVVTEDQYIAPLVEVLNEATPKPDNSHVQPSGPSETLKQSLDNLFPEQQYEDKAVQETKKALGQLAEGLSSDQLKDIASEVQYLMMSWLDDFEREVFGGLTLNELLHQKGGK